MNNLDLYSEQERKMMLVADKSYLPGAERIDELVTFAKQMNYSKIGIANCVRFEKQAVLLESILQEKGLETTHVNCKIGKWQKETLVPNAKGMLCNPAAQAQFLSDNQSQMNLVVGLCVGHDMVFGLHSKVPTTTLVVKDRKDQHIPPSLTNG